MHLSFIVYFFILRLIYIVLSLTKMIIFYQNVNRIRSKLNEFYLSVLNCSYDIICLTETNFNDSVLDTEYIDHRYIVFGEIVDLQILKKLRVVVLQSQLKGI